MPLSTFLGRVVAAGVSSVALAACTGALGSFEIDNSLATGGGGKEGGGGSAPDGAPVADGGGVVVVPDGAAMTDSGLRSACNGGNGRFIFLTADGVSGNFGGVTPIVTADALCRSAAKAGGLPGTYNAWLSTSLVTQTPGSLLTVPMYLPDCTVVIKNPAAYKNSQGMLDHPINEDQFGKVLGDGPAWTATQWDGTYVGGTPNEQTCANWNDSSNLGQTKGSVGSVGAPDDKWSSSGQLPCAMHARLYCVQVK